MLLILELHPRYIKITLENKSIFSLLNFCRLVVYIQNEEFEISEFYQKAPSLK